MLHPLLERQHARPLDEQVAVVLDVAVVRIVTEALTLIAAAAVGGWRFVLQALLETATEMGGGCNAGRAAVVCAVLRVLHRRRAVAVLAWLAQVVGARLQAAVRWVGGVGHDVGLGA